MPRSPCPNRGRAAQGPQKCYVFLDLAEGYVVVRAGRYGAGRELWRYRYDLAVPGSLAHAVAVAILKARQEVSEVFIDDAVRLMLDSTSVGLIGPGAAPTEPPSRKS